MPAVAYMETSKKFLVVWGDERNLTASGTDIYGRLVSDTGTPLGNDFLISGAASDQTEPRLACDPQADECLVVWQDRRASGDTGTDIWGQRVAGDGTLRGSNIPILAIEGEQNRPSVTFDSSSRHYLVLWHDDSGVPGGDFDIKGRILGTDGVNIGNVFLVAAAPMDQLRPVAAFNSTDKEFEVVWYDLRAQATVPNHPAEVYGQRLAVDGSLLGTNTLLATGTDNQYSPSISYDPINDDYMLLWYSVPSGSYLATVRNVIISSAGVTEGDQTAVCTTGWYPTLPVIAYNSNAKEFLATWDDGNSYATAGVDIYGMRLPAKAGVVPPGPTATPISPGQGGSRIMLPFLTKESQDTQ